METPSEEPTDLRNVPAHPQQAEAIREYIEFKVAYGGRVSSPVPLMVNGLMSDEQCQRIMLGSQLLREVSEGVRQPR